MLGYSDDEMVGKERQARLRLHLPTELAARGRELSAELARRSAADALASFAFSPALFLGPETW
jgi:hypothetical protein